MDELGDKTMAAESLARLRNIQASYSATPSPDKEEEAYLSILADDLNGLIFSKVGDMEAAIAQVQRAVATYDGMAFDFGPPMTIKPPQELLGELLLQQSKNRQARNGFEVSLQRAPKRAESLLGRARREGDGRHSSS